MRKIWLQLILGTSVDDLNLEEKPHPASYEELGFPEVRRQSVHFPLHCTVDILPTLHTPQLYVNDELPNAETEMKQKMEFFLNSSIWAFMKRLFLPKPNIY